MLLKHSDQFSKLVPLLPTPARVEKSLKILGLGFHGIFSHYLCLLELYGVDGKENGNYYSTLGSYWDNGQANGNYIASTCLRDSSVQGAGDRHRLPWRNHCCPFLSHCASSVVFLYAPKTV